MSSTALVRAKEALAKAHDRAKRAVADHKETIEETIGTVLTVGGGGIGGYIQGSMPNKEFMGVNANLAAGVLLVSAGLFEWAGKMSGYAGDVGKGMLAYESGRRVCEAVRASQGAVKGIDPNAMG